MVAVYIPDLAISLAWGLTRCEDFREEWAIRFRDQHVSSVYVDVLYHGVPVTRAVGVLVDGGRCMLPFPSTVGGVRTAAGDYVQLIRLVDSLPRHGSGFEKYFRMMDLHEVTTPIPWRTM